MAAAEDDPASEEDAEEAAAEEAAAQEAELSAEGEADEDDSADDMEDVDQEGSEDEDDDFDFDAIAEQAVNSVQMSRRRLAELPKFGLDVGLDGKELFFKGGNSEAFKTAVPHGVVRLNIADFSDGFEPSAPSTSREVREVRGVAPRPADDRMIRKKERKATKDDRLEKWFGLRKREHTPEVVKELKAIKLRGSADPKRFYKANDSRDLPKYFTFATEVGGGMAAAGETASTKEVTAFSGRSLLSTIMRDEKVQEFTWKKNYEVNSRGMASRHSGHGQGKPKRKAWKKQKPGRGKK